MIDPERPNKQIGRRSWSIFRFDMLLLAFLLIGWSLIFTTATLGLQNTQSQWLPVGLISQASTDYTAKDVNAPRLARVNPEIIEAVKQDQIFMATPTPSAVPTVTLTPTIEPTFTSVTALTALDIDIGGPYSGEEGSDIPVAAELTGSLLNLMPGVVSYVWDLDNDGQYDDYNGASTSVVFYDEGEYPISVQATDLLGQMGIVTATVSISNVAPLINIGQDISSIEGEEVAFTATATDPGHDVLLYEWDFGDGDPHVTDTLTPHHIYRDNDIYTVRLTVHDNDGGVTEASLIVKVDNEAPVVDAGPDQTTNEADTVAFSGSATDAGVLDTLTYEWDFNYNGHSFTTDATGATASTVYPNGPANIVAALRVRDKDEGETIDTVRVRVVNLPPLITAISNDGPVGEGSPLAVTVTASDVGNDPLTYSFDWNDDGSFEESSASDTASNIWFNQDDYTVQVKVDDGDGGEIVSSTTVSVFNQPPIAIASAGTGVLEGSSVSFDGSDSNDPGADTLTYQWSFGDGNSAGGGTDPNATHVYGDNGVYSATLTVTDDSGDSSSDSASVAILNANPTASAGADVTVDEGANVSLAYNATATDPGTADIPTLTYEWDFDSDGGFDDGLGASGTHIYPALDGPAESNIALRVHDDDYPFPTSGGGEIGEALDTFKLTVRNVSPWNITGGSYTCVENESIDLTASAEDVPTDVGSLQYAWDLDSNPNYEQLGQQVSYTCNQAGPQSVRLRVRDKDYNNNEDDAHDGESFGSAQVTISNAPPIAEANGPYTSTIGSSIVFDASGSNDPSPGPDSLTYRWNFGDGIIITNTNSITVTHAYADDGVYTATLRVDDGQDTDTDTAIVRINNLPPTAAATASPNPVVKGNSVTFDASGSTDPDDTNLTYQWDFGDGATDTGINVSHPYPNQGSFNAILTVIDDNGAMATDTIVITVNNTPPTALAAADQTTILKGGSVNFNGTGSTDPDPGDSLTYAWDFGDGNTGSGSTVSHSYNNPGTYNVTLTVTDGSGANDTDTIDITVNNTPPTAVAAANQTTVLEGDSINFNGTGSTDPDPGDSLTYAWDFGDGNTDSGPTVSHSYNDQGTYNVTLTVTDGSGANDTDTIVITVNNANPTAVASADLTTVNVGETINFDGSASSDPGNDTLTYAWDFGDGITDNSGPIVSHTWTIAGTYNIILQVDDGEGGNDTDTITVQVN